MKKSLVKVFGVTMLMSLFVLVGAARNADALSIRINDVGAGVEVEVSDGGLGFVSYTGTVGNFDTSMTTAVSAPIVGSAFFPRLDLNNLSVNSSSGGTLEVWASAQDFNNVGNIPNTFFSTAGTTDGRVTYELYSDSSNAEFGTGTYLGTLGTFDGIAHSGELIAALPGASDGLFSLTIKATIVHTAAGETSSFTSRTTPTNASAPVPEPATMLLLGSGLLGMGATKKRKKEENV